MANRDKNNLSKSNGKDFDSDKYYMKVNKKNRDSYRKKQRKRKSGFS